MMYKIILAAGAAALAFAAPASADPGKGKGHGNQAKHGQMGKGYGKSAKHGIYQGHATANFWGNRNCPPGLAKKNNGCLPPGQANRLFREGQRLPSGYNYYTDYNNIPMQYRNQYSLDPNNRYIYRDNSIYVVDPRTSVVERIIGSLTGL